MKLLLFVIVGTVGLSSGAVAADMDVRDLINKDVSKQAQAAAELRKNREAALPALLSALDAPEPELRAKSARLLKELKSPDSFKLLAAKAVSDTDWHVRQEAISAVGRFKHAEVEAVLRRALKDAAPQNRIAAARLLSFRSRTKALPELKLLLADEDKAVRLTAAREMGRHGDRSALPIARDGLRDADWRVRAAACDAIGTNGDTTSRALLDKIAADKSEKPAVRLAALQAQHQIDLNGKSSATEQVDFLEQSLGDPVGGVRAWAAFELARRAEPKALAILKRTGQDNHALGQREAEFALRSREGP